jgi:hypothetical protein
MVTDSFGTMEILPERCFPHGFKVHERAVVIEGRAPLLLRAREQAYWRRGRPRSPEIPHMCLVRHVY